MVNTRLVKWIFAMSFDSELLGSKVLPSPTPFHRACSSSRSSSSNSSKLLAVIAVVVVVVVVVVEVVVNY